MSRYEKELSEREKYIVLLNRSSTSKRQDNFLVSFFNMSENVGNYLGRQVLTISRPSITIEESKTRRKGNEYVNPSQLRFDPIQVVFSDDENSLTSMLLYAQIMRQREKYAGEVDDVFNDTDTEKRFKFGIFIQLFNSTGDVTESYVLKDCFINKLDHSESMMSGNELNQITINVSYDNIDVKVFDKFLSLTG